ncbi:hypothetical protein E0Z10_g3932 [Xylaria hypoxylon]|uniref:Uncharacterized protein n=1 Tax=Xylaria hypoxylon TaxID=37992 RepID=A0A4Z0YLY5_9PEZI|nr:hypothetical protein E0Z10_g3932 [Xylaria hypoxylon]
MPPPQQASAETSDNVANLHKLLQRPVNKDRIGPLVMAMLSHDIDIHATHLTALDNKVQQIKGSQSEHATHISEHMHKIERDLLSLLQLIPADEQKTKDITADIHQLKDRITEAMAQCHIESTGVKQDLKVISEAMERQQQASNKVADTSETVGQHIANITRDVNEIKDVIEKMSSNPLMVELGRKIEEKMTSSLDQISKMSSDIEDAKLSLAAIETKQGLYGNLACEKPAENDFDESIINDRTQDHSPTGQEVAKPQRLGLQGWPIIVQFVEIYEQFKETYKSKKPENETQFIETFLNKIGVHVSCVVQRHLLEMYPNRVALVTLDVDQQTQSIFIQLRRLRWNHIRTAIPKIEDLRALQWASDQKLTGPPQSLILKQGDQKRRAPTEEYVGTEQNISTSIHPQKRHRRLSRKNSKVSVSALLTDGLSESFQSVRA